MFAFAIRRLIQAAGVMLVVALISFLMFRFVGDPVNQLVGVDTTPEQRAQLRVPAIVGLIAILLIPVADTAKIDPFMLHTTLSIICDVRDPITKKEYSRDPRSIARKAVAFLQKVRSVSSSQSRSRSRRFSWLIRCDRVSSE